MYVEAVGILLLTYKDFSWNLHPIHPIKSVLIGLIDDYLEVYLFLIFWKEFHPR
jgi:hypothetical protein